MIYWLNKIILQGLKDEASNTSHRGLGEGEKKDNCLLFVHRIMHSAFSFFVSLPPLVAVGGRK